MKGMGLLDIPFPEGHCNLKTSLDSKTRELENVAPWVYNRFTFESSGLYIVYSRANTATVSQTSSSALEN